MEKFASFIPIDGEASSQQVEKILSLLPSELRKLPIEEIVAIGKLINAQKSAVDIAVPLYFDVQPIKQAEVNWEYGLKVFGQEKI